MVSLERLMVSTLAPLPLKMSWASNRQLGFWDPLGFTKTDDALSFRRRRYVELKHGRVAMFACLGYIVPVAASFMKRKDFPSIAKPQV